MKYSSYALLPAVALAASSSGCGTTAPASSGKTTSMSATFDGTKRTWRLYVPSSYSKSTPMPIVVSHHGWGGSGSSDQSAGGMALQAESQGFIIAHPDGYADNSNRGSWASWNCVGSTQSPGPKGVTCASWANPTGSYCYDSCKKSSCKDNCDWTTCLSDVTPTGIGTKNVDGFIPQLFDYLEQSFCVDTAREYATGMSNGGMMTYQVGASMSSRLAAIAPVAGAFHNGFIQAPSEPVALYDIHGTRDSTVPPCSSSDEYCTSADGWTYSGTAATAAVWAKANGCTGASKTYKTSYDGTSSLSCSIAGSCSGAETVSCSWSGSHTYFASTSSKNGGLVWELLSKNSKASWTGATDPHRLVNITTVEAPRAVAPMFDWLEAPAVNATKHHHHTHYGNPNSKAGCRSDEDAVTLDNGLVTGHVCAPKKLQGVAGARTFGKDEAPCGVGGQGPSDDGCPTDLPAPNNGTHSAWPACKYDVLDAKEHPGLFHCTLTCGPCRVEDGNDCTPEAHAQCPRGAACHVGFDRNTRFGTCLYDAKASATA